MVKALPPLKGPPPGDPNGFGLGERGWAGWSYVCSACGATCVVPRRRWTRTGNKANGWAVVRDAGRVVALCPKDAVAQVRRAAGV